MVLNKDNKFSPDLSQEERPVSKASWLNRFFVASFTLIGISLGMVLKDLFWPSTANAAVAQERITTSRQSVQKNWSSSTNFATLHDSNLLEQQSSFLGQHVPERAGFKRAEKTQEKVLFMVKKEPLQMVSARRVERPFPIEKDKFLDRSKKNILIRPSHAWPGLSDYVQVYESLKKGEKRKMETVETFIKDNKIVDPRLIKRVKDANANLSEKILSDSKRDNVVLDVLERMSASCHQLASNTSLTEQHKDLFLQETGVGVFVLEAAFSSKNLTLAKTIKQNLPKLPGSNVSFNDPEAWEDLNYKTKGVLASDLAVELTQLRDYLGIQEPYFLEAIKVVSLTKNYCKMQLSEVDNIVRKGWEEQTSANRGRNAALTNTVIKINALRGKSIFSYYDNTFRVCFENQVSSANRQKLSDIRERRCLSDIIEVSQLNADVLSYHGFC
uniref:hypothetical protein n=1 Tax=Klebsormidium crenulatum TaxID=424406 RepID=UPI00286A6A57|nr:hypothetical protein RMD54_pgp111 [Klebsormidium crenulatum]WKT06374.1 hypothetical protein [Klebsormidium crenulatum]